MERDGESGKSSAPQLDLAWKERIRWEEPPAQVRLQVRDELARLLMQLAVGTDVEEAEDDD